MNEKLKPVRCGCGGEAEVDCYLDCYNTHDLYYVYCKNCYIQSANYYTEAEAITAWNKAMGATDMNVGDKFAKDINVPNKGKWLWDEEEDRCYCSECGNEDDLSIDGVYMMHDFCPNCGADMRISHE